LEKSGRRILEFGLLGASISVYVAAIVLANVRNVSSSGEYVFPFRAESTILFWAALAVLSSCLVAEVLIKLGGKKSSLSSELLGLGTLLVVFSILELWIYQSDMTTRCLNNGCTSSLIRDYAQIFTYLSATIFIGGCSIAIGWWSRIRPQAPNKELTPEMN
jgi:hypothetical protein